MKLLTRQGVQVEDEGLTCMADNDIDSADDQDPRRRAADGSTEGVGRWPFTR
jgi:hypothetical protein